MKEELIIIKEKLNKLKNNLITKQEYELAKKARDLSINVDLLIQKLNVDTNEKTP